jgi:Trypsin
MKRIPIQSALQNHSRMALYYSLSVLAVAPTLVSCGAEGGPVEELESARSEIIGGSAISVTTRRAFGLLDVSSGCSASLISPDWALTATHCLNLANPTLNGFSAPRLDGAVDTRQGVALSQVGSSDTTIVQLAPARAGMTWPTVARGMSTSPFPGNLIGQNITCYGRGSTAYASPSGLNNAGQWRQLITPVAQFDGVNLLIKSNNGVNILAPGDSGGPCLFNNLTVGTASSAPGIVCANPSTPDTCKQTITRIDIAAIATTYPYANYINSAPLRAATTTFVPLALAPGWSNAGMNSYSAGIVALSGVVHFRGAITTSGTATFPFTVPLGYRPPTDVYVPINLCGGFKGRLYIKPTGETEVQAEDGAWANAQCLTSLDGASFSAVTLGATAIGLSNGWVGAPYATRPVAVRNVAGMIRLEGALAGGAGPTAFSLPPGFRPPTRVYAPVDLCNAAKGRITILPTGEVTIQTEGGFGAAQCFTSLEGVSFAASSNGFSILFPVNGWTAAPFSTRTPAVQNIGGVVRFQGAMATTGTDPNALLLPEVMRPAANVYIPIDLCGAKKGRLVVQPDGRVFVESVAPWSQTRCFASLEGASFGL